MNTQRTPTLGPCHCKRGQQRDNCPACEGTGQRINFPLLRLQLANLAKPGAKWTPETGWTNEPINEPTNTMNTPATPGPFWQVSCTVIHNGASTHTPTFYLHSNVHGVACAKHAAHVAWGMIARLSPKGSRIVARAVDATDGSACAVNLADSHEVDANA